MHNTSILAIAVRARWIGYATIEGRCTIVDWGMVFFRPSREHQIKSAKRRIERLIARYPPMLIVLSLPEASSGRFAPSCRSIVRSVRAEATAHSIPVRVFHRACVRHFFRDSGAHSKQEIAHAVANLFPELRRHLPAKRKIWEKEHFRMTMFDAVAAGVACWREVFNLGEECSGHS